MANRTDRPIVPVVHTDEVEHRRLLATRVNAAMPKDGTEGMSAPLRLSVYLEADLPDPTLWSGSAVYVSDLSAVAISDGASWLFLTPAVTPTPPPSPGIVLLHSHDFADEVSESIDIATYSDYEQIKLVVSNVTQTVDDEYFCRARFSFDSGSTFKDAAGDYYFAAYRNYSDGAETFSADHSEDADSFYSAWISSDSAYIGNHEMTLHNPYSSTAYKLASICSYAIASSSYYVMYWKASGVCWYTDAIDQIEIFPGSGTFSGRWTVYGIATE